MPWPKIREALDQLLASVGFDSGFQKPPQHHSAQFTAAFIALAAKMAKADGVAVDVESQAFRRCFRVPDEEMPAVQRLFDLAKKDIAGYEAYAAQIGRMLADEPNIRADVFECLFHVATADGVLHKAEEEFLKVVASQFDLDATEYETIRHLFVHDGASPFEIIGVSPAASEAELKARYKDLVKAHHPDRLAADGVPEEFRSAADRKLAAINAAFDEIIRMRAAREPAR